MKSIVAAFIIFSSLFFLSYSQAAKKKLTMTHVKNSHVCMNKDLVYKDAQKLVQVGEKKYYACCPVCYKILKTKPESRYTKDPVTDEKIDKSTAYIVLFGARAYYFKNKENAAKYAERFDAQLVD